ncbi:MAG: hypothetical protein IJ678_06695 [Kiritimatiellae bacterium]|nr:hypothetical protein [Kiritimatiellia bacterium]
MLLKIKKGTAFTSAKRFVWRFQGAILGILGFCALGAWTQYLEKAKAGDGPRCFTDLPGTWQVYSEEENPGGGGKTKIPVEKCTIDLLPSGEFIMHNWNLIPYEIQGTALFSSNRISGTWEYEYDCKMDSGYLNLQSNEADGTQSGFFIGALWTAWRGNNDWFQLLDNKLLIKCAP